MSPNLSGWSEKEIKAWLDSGCKKIPARLKADKPAHKKVKGRPPVRKKPVKKTRKKPRQRVDRWLEQQLYQAKDSPFRPADYEILFREPGNNKSNLSRADVSRFLFDHHYIGNLPNGAHYLYGLWHKPTKELVGVAAYGQSGTPPVLKSSFPGLDDPEHKSLDVSRFKRTGKKIWLPDPRKVSQYAVELLRLALLTGVPKNAESWFVDKNFARLRDLDKRAVISFSDPVVGHVGTIYKALSAVYTGTSSPSWVWRLPDGTIYHNRHKTKIEAADPCHGSGKSISGLAEAKSILTKLGGPPKRGECLRKWQDRVLNKRAKREPGPGKMRYIWGLTKTQEGEIRQRLKRGDIRLKELLAKGWDEERIRNRMEEDRRSRSKDPKERLLQRYPFYPCGACLAPFPDHKTEDCPDFDPRRGAVQTVNPGGRPMRTEQRLAEIRRRIAGGDQAAGPLLLAELERAGTLNQAQLHILAYLDDPWARKLGVKPPPGGRGFARISNEILEWFNKLQTSGAEGDTAFSDMILAAASSAFYLHPGVESDREGGINRYLSDILRRAGRFGTATVAKVMVRGFNRLLAPSDPPVLRAVGRFAALQADTEEVWPAAGHVSESAARVLEQAYYLVSVQNFDRCQRRSLSACENCGRLWCDRCDPAPSALCHWCHGRGYSTAEVPSETGRRKAVRAATPELRNMIRSTLYEWWKIA